MSTVILNIMPYFNIFWLMYVSNIMGAIHK